MFKDPVVKRRDKGKCSVNWPEHPIFVYCKDSKYKDRSAGTNSADPDQTAPKEQSDQGLHCLPVHLYLLDVFLQGDSFCCPNI